MEDVVTASLWTSFRQVPSAAVPAMLDCILASSNSSPSLLFSSLVKGFPNIVKEIMQANENLSLEQCNYVVSYVGALCHLLKKSGDNAGGLELFILKVLIPLLKLVHTYDHEILNQVTSLFYGVVVETNNWEIVESTLVPFFLRSIELSMGMLQSYNSTTYKWTVNPAVHVLPDQPTEGNFFQDSNDQHINLSMIQDFIMPQPESFPLSISCQILTSVLVSALQSRHLKGTTQGLTLAKECCVERLSKNLLWDLCSVTLQMLLQNREHRSSAISFLLPLIFRAFVSEGAFEVLVNGQTCWLSWKVFSEKIWNCCRALISLGSLERRDAYAVLSLFLSFFSCPDGYEDGTVVCGDEAFDLRHEKEFWDAIKMGLVDKKGLVRKQSLHILKAIIHMSVDIDCFSGGSGNVPYNQASSPHDLTRRGRWADKEAKSLGVGKIYNANNLCLNSVQRWGAFCLLYEMLEEYGTHLVEAAWNHQVMLLLKSSTICDDSISSIGGGLFSDQMETVSGIFKWLAVLWERGLCHDNPQVRCLIMQSFLDIEWNSYQNCANLVPVDFVLGPFVDGLNDPVHHKDFGLRGVYSSKTMEDAIKFLHQYASSLYMRKKVEFLNHLASFAKKHSLSRSGLMALVECVASAACGLHTHNSCEVKCFKDGSFEILQEADSESCFHNDKADFLDTLRFIIESSKQHFNPNYRFQVCERIVDAAASVMSVVDVPLETLLHFISAIPKEFSICNGSLRVKLQEWLSGSDERHFPPNSCDNKVQLLVYLVDFPRTFISHLSVSSFATYDDEDIDAWASEARRWARVFFLVVKEEQHLDLIVMFLHKHAIDVCKPKSLLEWEPMKFLILIVSLVQEIQLLQDKTSEYRMRIKSEHSLPKISLSSVGVSTIFEKFYKWFLVILEELVAFAKTSCSVFWSNVGIEEKDFPGSIRGRLGGPSQRRLSSIATTIVLKAITSMRTVSIVSSWCIRFKSDVSLHPIVSSIWELSRKMISSLVHNSKTEAEICLAAYEALAYSLSALVPGFSLLALDAIVEDEKSWLDKEVGKTLLDSFTLAFVQNINDLIEVGNLVRTRRAILLNWKWICLESLLSIPKHALTNGVHLEGSSGFFSVSTVRWIFNDLVDSLENAGEDFILSMLRSVRLILELFDTPKMGSAVLSCNGVDVQMMWRLVQSAWVLHMSCNKRRVAPIAALLSSVLHHSVFRDERMHKIDNAPGPLKWFIQKLLEEGTRSPRTIRLAALHLTGLWLENPAIIPYYMKELKLLTLYGSVAFDEDFESELAENHDAKSELSVLAKSPDPELTEEFINTELFARVSVAVLFYKMSGFADTLQAGDNKMTQCAFEAGKMFLLELLDSVVYEKDLSKELYKKYSAIHRRKIRAWQMICILSRFIDQDIIEKVTSSLYTSLYRNNFPGVRQYMETFLIHIYLKFPSLVREQLVPILRNYDTRPQALSSYVFVAANVILHSIEAIQLKHLDELLPPIIPLLTSHHHTLRGFTQLLVHQVLQKLLPAWNHSLVQMISLERRCLEDFKSYLSDNSDCSKLRASMEGYLDAFDPKKSITPAGIFSTRVEEIEFECVPISLMERVIFFLNGAREELRCTMAKDAETLKNERMQMDGDPSHTGASGVSNSMESPTQLPEGIIFDFQRKITFPIRNEIGIDSSFFFRNNETLKLLLDMEHEDQLVDYLLHSRSVAVEESRASRQPFILVASFLDRVPNLAGLARTCEVFKAAALAIADKSILHDKQFQLISVTAEKWVPIVEVPVSSVKIFLEKKKQEGFSILGLEQTANSISLDQFVFAKKTVMVLGREKEGIPVEIIHILDACVEIPQLGVVRSLNVHVSGAIALWEYTRQQTSS